MNITLLLAILVGNGSKIKTKVATGMFNTILSVFDRYPSAQKSRV